MAGRSTRTEESERAARKGKDGGTVGRDEGREKMLCELADTLSNLAYLSCSLTDSPVIRVERYDLEFSFYDRLNVVSSTSYGHLDLLRHVHPIPPHHRQFVCQSLTAQGEKTQSNQTPQYRILAHLILLQSSHVLALGPRLYTSCVCVWSQ